jgi:hypothetical protein
MNIHLACSLLISDCTGRGIAVKLSLHVPGHQKSVIERT